ncbi:DUF3054 domain-containing protein [Natrialbaceae archaeon A-gly3]
MVETARGFGIDTREATLLFLVDVSLLAGLVLVGQHSHGIDPLADPLGALETMAPFVIGWIVIAPIARVYARGVLESPREVLRVTTVGWIAAANVGLILRSSPAFDGTGVWAFNIVMTGLGLVALLVWRLVYVAVRRH